MSRYSTISGGTISLINSTNNKEITTSPLSSINTTTLLPPIFPDTKNNNMIFATVDVSFNDKVKLSLPVMKI